MTLVKSKPKVTSNMRKMHGAHHRRNQRYMRPYWPYLPIVLILGGGAVANQYLPATFGSYVATSSSSARVDSVVGGHYSLLIGALTVVLVVLVAWFALRHLKQIKKLAFEGEKLVTTNFMFDAVVALVISGLYVLIR